MGFRDNNRGGKFGRGGGGRPRSFSGGGDRGGRGGGRGFGGDRGGGRGGFDRRPGEMFDATCSNCGKACQVPFRPTGSKPVLCSDCFRKNDSPRGNNSDSSSGMSANEFKQINAKLDKILMMLENLEVVEEIEEDEDDMDDEDEDDEDSDL